METAAAAHSQPNHLNVSRSDHASMFRRISFVAGAVRPWLARGLEERKKAGREARGGGSQDEKKGLEKTGLCVK